MQNKKLNELTECAICCETLRDPVALPCLHVFCGSPCMKDWTNKGDHICPFCRAPFTLQQIKSFHFLKNFLEEFKAPSAPPCPSCNTENVELSLCEHCNDNVCAICSSEHLELLKEEVSHLCEILNSETSFLLEQQNENIALLLSKTSSEKTELLSKLQTAHDTILAQIYELKQRSLKVLDDVQAESRVDVDSQQSTEIDTLIKRIDILCSEGVNPSTERDVRNLMKFDSEISQLQRDIENFQLRETNKKLKNTHLDREKICLKNLKINQAYKNIVAQLEETDMLKRVRS